MAIITLMAATISACAADAEVKQLLASPGMVVAVAEALKRCTNAIFLKTDTLSLIAVGSCRRVQLLAADILAASASSGRLLSTSLDPQQQIAADVPVSARVQWRRLGCMHGDGCLGTREADEGSSVHGDQLLPLGRLLSAMNTAGDRMAVAVTQCGRMAEAQSSMAKVLRDLALVVVTMCTAEPSSPAATTVITGLQKQQASSSNSSDQTSEALQRFEPTKPHPQFDGCQALAEAAAAMLLQPLCTATVSDLKASVAAAAAADLALQKAKVASRDSPEATQAAIWQFRDAIVSCAAHSETSGTAALMAVAAVSQAVTCSSMHGSGGWMDLPFLPGEEGAKPLLGTLHSLTRAGVPELLAEAGAACRGLLDRSAQQAQLWLQHLHNSSDLAEAKRGGGADEEIKRQKNQRVLDRHEAEAAATVSEALTWRLSRVYPSAVASFEALACLGTTSALSSGQRSAECVEGLRQFVTFTTDDSVSRPLCATACLEAIASSQLVAGSCMWLKQLLSNSSVSSLLLAPEPHVLLQPCLMSEEDGGAQEEGSEAAQSSTWLFGGQLMGMLVGRLLSHLTLVAEEVHELVEACRPGLDAGGDSRGSSQVQPGGEAVGSGEAALAVEAARAVDAAFSCLEDVALSAELSAVALAKLLFLSSQLDAVLEAGLEPSGRLEKSDCALRQLHDAGLLVEGKGENMRNGWGDRLKTSIGQREPLALDGVFHIFV